MTNSPFQGLDVPEYGNMRMSQSATRSKLATKRFGYSTAYSRRTPGGATVVRPQALKNSINNENKK
eukprot:6488459-Amphidinium_carterae.1